MFLRRRRLIAAYRPRRRQLRPAALRHRPGRPPPQHHHRRAADRQPAPRWSRCASSPTSASASSPSIFETLIMQNLLGQARADAGPRRELEAHRRAHRRVVAAQGREVPQRRRDDGRRRGLHLQPRAHVRRRTTTSAEQDAVHHRCWSRDSRRGQEAAAGSAGSRQAHLARRSRRSRRSTSTPCASSTARPTSRSKAASARSGSEIISRRGFDGGQDLDRLGAQADRDRPLQGARVQARRVADRSTRMTNTGAAGRRSRRIRFVVVPEVASRINGLLAGQYDFICDVPPDQIAGIEKNAKFEVQGGPITNHRITVFDKHHPQLADPRVRQAFTHAIDRQAIVDSLWAGRTRVPPGLQWEFYGPMFIESWTVPDYDPTKAQALLKAANYKGDPIPFRLLNNYYTNQVATAQIDGRDVARRSGSTCRSRCARTGSRSSRATASARCATGRTARPSTIRSARSSASTGRRASSSRSSEWTNEEMNKLSAAHGDRDRHGQAQGDVQAHAGDLRARGPRLYGAAPERDLHRQAQGHRLEGRARLRDGFPRRSISPPTEVRAAAHSMPR